MLQQNQLCGYTIRQFVAENLKKKNYRQIFLMSRRIGKDVTFGASAQTMRRLKHKFKISHEIQKSSRDARATLSHSPQSSFNQLTVQHVLDCGGKLERPPITCKLQKDRAKPKLCFCEAAVLPLHHRAALHSHSARLFLFFYFFLFQHHAISLVSLPHHLSPHEAAGSPRITTAHSISWNGDNSRLISVTSYRAWWLQTASKQAEKVFW